MKRNRENWIDKVVSYVAPVWGLKRTRARAIAGLYRGYEGASKGTRTTGWTSTAKSADSENQPALALLMQRSREILRNNPYGVSILNTLVSEMVGTGIIPRARGNDARAKKLDELWKAYGAGDNFLIDADRLDNAYGLQENAAGILVESGAVLMQRIWRRPTKENPFPLEIRLLEPDHIDFAKTRNLENGRYIKQGIEFDSRGKRLAYWLFPEHPGELGILRQGIVSARVDSADIVHVFRRRRTNQHGVPWLHAIIKRLYDFDDFEDARAVKEKVSACYAAFVRDSVGTDADLADDETDLEKLQPGRIEKLPPGKDIVFANPPRVDGYGEYGTAQKQSFGSGSGVSYESVTGDLSRTNFASARIGQEKMHRFCDRARDITFIPKFCATQWRWFEEACDLAGLIPQGAPTGADWTPQPRVFIQPVDDTEARKTQVRIGMKTPSQLVREQGRDPDTHWTEYAQDVERLKALGITIESVVGPASPPPAKEPGGSAGKEKNDDDENDDDENE